jgi:hypothetical protein
MRTAALAIALCATGSAQAKDDKFGDIDGWYVTGPGDDAKDFRLTDYEGGMDTRIKHRGKASAFLRSTVDKPDKHAVVMQSVRSDHYRGKRIRVSAWLRTEGVTDEACLWVRVVPIDRDTTLSRAAVPLRGTLDWKRYEVVLDVSVAAHSIMYGLSLHGTGKAWIDDMTWEVVDASVPTVGVPSPSEPADPSNLDFERGR